MVQKLNLNYDEVLDVFNRLGSYRKTAKVFNTSHVTISKILNNYIKDNEKYNLKNIKRL